MTEPFRCELVSWHRIYQMSRLLAAEIRSRGFVPDIVVAIARGGFVPARILCDYLDISTLTSIQVTHYTAGASRKKCARLAAPLTTDVRGLHVLIVDDVNDTGETLAVALEHISGFQPADVRVAVLHTKQVSTFRSDFYVGRVVKWRWLIYPWAVIEDVTGLLDKMPARPATPEEAALFFARQFRCRVPLAILRDVYALAGWTSPPAAGVWRTAREKVE